ncbi:MAG: chorismate mutase [Candidatus Taylorbacteria bacterium]
MKMKLKMKLEKSRKEIDKIDIEIVELLAKRRDCSAVIGKYKKENGLKIYQPEREREILEKKADLAKKVGVSADLVRKIFRHIFKDSRDVQGVVWRRGVSMHFKKGFLK